MSDLLALFTRCIVFVFATPDSRPIGTAFIIGYPIEGRDNQVIPLVVTAKHVVKNRGIIYLRFTPRPGDDSQFYKYDLQELQRDNDFWTDPDPAIDLAVFRTKAFAHTLFEPFPIKWIASKALFKEEDVKPTDRVIFPSLLSNYFGSKKNVPVFRDGMIAQIPEEDIPVSYKEGDSTISHKQPAILLDATSIPGASGSPVFLSTAPRFKNNKYQLTGTVPLLIGVVQGFYGADREITEIELSDLKQFYRENLGIAICIPAWALHDILDKPSLKQRMTAMSEEIN